MITFQQQFEAIVFSSQFSTIVGSGLTAALVSGYINHFHTSKREREKDERFADQERKRYLLGKLEELVGKVLEVLTVHESYGDKVYAIYQRILHGEPISQELVTFPSPNLVLETRADWLQDMYFPDLELPMKAVNEGTLAVGEYVQQTLNVMRLNPTGYVEANSQGVFAERHLVEFKQMWAAYDEFLNASRAEVQKLLG